MNLFSFEYWRGLSEKIREYAVFKEEREILDKFFRILATNDKLVAYGANKIKYLLEISAIEELLIAEDFLYYADEFIDKAIKTNTKIKIISKAVPRYNELIKFGGIVAILRYPLD